MAKGISITLLFLIGIIFIVQLSSPTTTSNFDFNPLKALSEPWRFITSVFLHGSFEHILFNGLALFMFGSVLERVITTKQYLTLYLGAGIIGGILYYLTFLLGIIPPIPALGASGAIYGIMGALAILVPNLTVYMWFAPMKIRYAAVLWIILEFIGTFNISSGIASAAHLGGLVFGIIYGIYLKRQIDSEYYTHPQSAI